MTEKALERQYRPIDELWSPGNPQLIRVRRISSGNHAAGNYVVKIFPAWSTIQECRQKFQSWSSLPGKFALPPVDWGAWMGQCALVFEYVEGASLRALLGHETLSQAEVRELLGQVQLGLIELKESGLCHGDISLGNIILDRLGRVRLIDYDSIGQRAQVCATPQFVAPEVWLGADPSFASDLFGLGMLQKYLTGVLPLPNHLSIDKLRCESLNWVDETHPWLHPNPHSRRLAPIESQPEVQEKLAWRVCGYLLRCGLDSSTVEINTNPERPISRLASTYRIRFLALLVLVLCSGFSSESQSRRPWGQVSIRSRRWVKVEIENKDLGYAPLTVQLRAGQYYLHWTSHRSRGRKLLTVSSGGHKVITDSDLFEGEHL